MQKPATQSRRNPSETRARLVESAVRLFLRQGYAASSVEDICREAGVTKGSFFHHFPNKETLAAAAVEWWGRFGTSLYAQAWEDSDADPLDQLRRLFAIMSGFTENENEVCTCVVGMLSQELAQTHPTLREACDRELNTWTANCARLLAAAKAKHAPMADFDPEAVAWYLNSLWQGSMLVAKTKTHPDLIRSNLRLALRWVESLLNLPAPS